MPQKDSLSPRIVTVGSINIDLVAQMERLPAPGETVSAKSLLQIPGGKGANQAVAASLLQASSLIIGRVGDDSFAPLLKQELENKGVDTQYLLHSKSCSSGVALIGIDENGENSIVIASGANGMLTPSDVQCFQAAIIDADILLVQLEVPLETVIAAIKIAKANNVFIVLDPAPAPRESLPKELIAVDLLTPNQTEAEMLTGLSVRNFEESTVAALLLQSQGAKQVVIKMGSQGALVCDAKSVVTHILPPVVNVVDTTAAGDAFTAAMAVRLAEDNGLIDAVQFACFAGAIATTRLGAQPAMPSRKEVIQLMNSCH